MKQLGPILRQRRSLSSSAVPSWKTFATVDPWKLSASSTHHVKNLLNGQWVSTAKEQIVIDPMNGEEFLCVPSTSLDESKAFVSSLNQCPKSGLHNPIKSPERYNLLGEVTAKAAAKLRNPEMLEFFAKLIQRVAPKSGAQALGEVKVTQKFLENFGGDQVKKNPLFLFPTFFMTSLSLSIPLSLSFSIYCTLCLFLILIFLFFFSISFSNHCINQVRFLARSFGVPGDHYGQTSHGYRWPYGPVSLITPFNFPIEIPMLQLMGALYMGNKVKSLPLPFHPTLSLLSLSLYLFLHTFFLIYILPISLDLSHFYLDF